LAAFGDFAGFAAFAARVRDVDAVEPRFAAADFNPGDFAAAGRRVVDSALVLRPDAALAVAFLPLLDPLDARLPAAGGRAVLRGLVVAMLYVSGIPPPCSGDRFDSTCRMQDR
jgi:hypothetical protein